MNRLPTRLLRAAATTLAVTLLGVPSLAAQLQTQTLEGVVRAQETGQPLAGVTVQVQGQDGPRTVTDAQGRFLLREVPSGIWTLEVLSSRYGARTYVVEVEYGGFTEVEINLEGPAAGEPGRAPAEEAGGPSGGLGHTVDAATIRAVAPSVRTVGELIRQTVPAFRSRSSSAVAGSDFCLEFRSRGPRSLMVPEDGDPGALYCNHPDVYLDGVPVQDPDMVYQRSSLDDLRRIQAISPAEAAGVFGAAVNGVILVETRYMRASTPTSPGTPGRTGFVPARRSSFDWSQDPAGHSFGRTFVGALLGNAAGLAAGVAVGRQCVFIEDRTQDIEFSCGNAGVAGAGFAAVALPALGSALGANLLGRTERSSGRFVPSVVGGAMGAVPGYIFALATVGEGVETMNAVGKGFLILAPPLLTTVADRLYRSLR